MKPKTAERLRKMINTPENRAKWDEIERGLRDWQNRMRMIYEPLDMPDPQADADELPEATLECGLLESDVAILNYLAEQPGVAKTQIDIAAGADLERKATGRRLQYLKKHGLVKSPEGRTRGNLITPAGMGRVQKCPKSDP